MRERRKKVDAVTKAAEAFTKSQKQVKPPKSVSKLFVVVAELNKTFYGILVAISFNLQLPFGEFYTCWCVLQRELGYNCIRVQPDTFSLLPVSLSNYVVSVGFIDSRRQHSIVGKKFVKRCSEEATRQNTPVIQVANHPWTIILMMSRMRNSLEVNFISRYL